MDGMKQMSLGETGFERKTKRTRNAAMESFFSSMKTERLSRKVYRTREEARSDVFDYIERDPVPGFRTVRLQREPA